MPKKLIKVVNIETPDNLYDLEFFSDHEICLRALREEYDPLAVFGEEPDTGWGTYARSHTGKFSITLYKTVKREVIAYLHQYRPYCVWFTTGFDDSRSPLYLRFARSLIRHGYEYIDSGNDQPEVLRCYRMHQSTAAPLQSAS